MDHVPKEFAEKMRVPYEGIVAEKEAIITQLQPALKALRQKQNTWVDTASALRLQVDALQIGVVGSDFDTYMSLSERSQSVTELLRMYLR
ncbi:unnamed protein product [Albugo candida]|uniref:Uncharacterized protein n=1 Tax=Albugo candida TaxID=65357 RepID=A0A024FX92_9STRA|nr:unnamed protein product [Albugo candida]|eukprot:CCI11641.1 unnamed protein product [Albugo candida]